MQQVVGRLSVARRDADARRDRERDVLETGDAERLFQDVHQPLGEQFRPRVQRYPLCQHHELVAAEPAHRVAPAQHADEAGGHGLQQLVSGHVPQGVVDNLEVVQIHVERADEVTTALGSQQHLLSTIEDERPVGEPGQRVVARLMPELLLGAVAKLLGRLLPGDVEDHPVDPKGPSVMADDDPAMLGDPCRRAVGVHEPVLERERSSPSQRLVDRLVDELAILRKDDRREGPNAVPDEVACRVAGQVFNVTADEVHRPGFATLAPVHRTRDVGDDRSEPFVVLAQLEIRRRRCWLNPAGEDTIVGPHRIAPEPKIIGGIIDATVAKLDRIVATAVSRSGQPGKVVRRLDPLRASQRRRVASSRLRRAPQEMSSARDRRRRSREGSS